MKRCTYCGNRHVVAKMDTGALRSLPEGSN